MPCKLAIDSDTRLLEQMIWNLLSNALKYTKEGKVLLGCRRHGDNLSIEVWDTGLGIPSQDLLTIFEEYQQLGNAEHNRSNGLGLGLSIVRRLGDLLEHKVRVRSQPGKGSVFSIEVKCAKIAGKLPSPRPAVTPSDPAVEGLLRSGVILLIEDEDEVRDLLKSLLGAEGHRVETAADGATALSMAGQGGIRPDLVISDFNLPNGMNGLQVAAALREKLQLAIPVVILTGDISTTTLRGIVEQDCVQLSKPVKLAEISRVIQTLLPQTRPRSAPGLPQDAGNAAAPVIFVVDDDSDMREIVCQVLEAEGRQVEDFGILRGISGGVRTGAAGLSAARRLSAGHERFGIAGPAG